jgi:hypothetical protein
MRLKIKALLFCGPLIFVACAASKKTEFRTPASSPGRMTAHEMSCRLHDKSKKLPFEANEMQVTKQDENQIAVKIIADGGAHSHETAILNLVLDSAESQNPNEDYFVSDKYSLTISKTVGLEAELRHMVRGNWEFFARGIGCAQ